MWTTSNPSSPPWTAVSPAILWTGFVFLVAQLAVSGNCSTVSNMDETTSINVPVVDVEPSTEVPPTEPLPSCSNIHLYPEYQYDTLPESDIIVRRRQNTSLPVLRHVSSRDHQPYLPEDLVRSKRGATADEGKIWPNGIIPYMIDGTFPDKTKEMILQAMRHWEKHTTFCLEFLERDNQADYALFVKGIGCCSSVGRQGGMQMVIIGSGCERFGIILHEVGHLVGFWHEQSRPDRDDYVTILPQNIFPSELHNFHKSSVDTVDSFDQPYDYDSIMHYGERVFAINSKPTIQSKASQPIGQKIGLSVGDIVQTRLLYRCTSISDCGGTVFGNQGLLTSPGYPHPYTTKQTCDWSVGADVGHAIRIEFYQLDLPVKKGGECRETLIEIREGYGILAPKITHYCGYRKPRVLILDSGRLWLRFRSGSQRNHRMKGFILRFKSVSPPRMMTSSQGAVKSLNYPLPLPRESDQIWVITQPKGFFVLLKVIELNIAVSRKTGCHGDYLLILDGAKSYSDVITKLCRHQAHVGLISSGRELRIELHTEKFGARDGQHTKLSAYYKARDVNECLTNNGGCDQACKNIVGSHLCGCRYGYRSFDIFKCRDIDECADHNAGCSHICVNTEGSFRCACPPGYVLSPGNATQCIDEDECSDPSKNVCQQICINIPGSYSCSCEDGLYLNKDGFSCEMFYNCSGNVSNEYEGVISSPVIPTSIRNPINCFWNILTYTDLTLTLRFLLDDWKPSKTCADYIIVTANQGAIRMREESFRLCPNVSKLEDYHSDSHLLRVQFHSEWPHSSNFQLEYYTRENVIDWSKTCGGRLNGSGILKSPGYPKYYPPNTKCLWQAVGAVRLKFHMFDLEREDGCLYDYIEVRDGQGFLGTNIRRFCGRRPPPDLLVTSTGMLYIEFRSDSSIQMRGFVAYYYVENT